MKKNTLFFTLLCCFVFSGNLLAQMLLKEVPLKTQVENSNLIVEGEVVAKKSFWDDNHHNIYTANTVKVYKVFKGEQSKTIEVITLGGTVDNEALMVSPGLKLRKGDIGTFMLYNNSIPLGLQSKSSNKKYRTYSSLQGFYKYNLQDNIAVNPFSKKKGISNLFYDEILNYTKSNYIEIFEYYTNNNFKSKQNQAIGFLPPASITFSPTTGSAGTKTVITISGSGFGATKGNVGFSNADDGGATFINALDTQILTWSDTEITVQIPSDAGTGTIRVTHNDTTTGVSAATLTITYSQLNVPHDPGTGTEGYQTQHVDRNGNGGYIWQMHTDFDGNAAAKASFLSAFEIWRCETGVNWDIGATTTTDVIADDNINIIRFDNGSELPVGVLGRCTSRWTGCGGGATVKWYVEELDIAFDDGTDWYFGSSLPAFAEYDFESVSLHELGHGHQLGHVIDNSTQVDNGNDVMHYAISNSEQQRVLSPNNIAAGNNVQSRSTSVAVCSQSLMTNHSCSLSVEEDELSNAINLYPNPAKNQFYISNAPYINLEKVVVYDISGRLISKHDVSNSSRLKTIDLVGVSKGVYFVSIHSDRASITKKIILE